MQKLFLENLGTAKSDRDLLSMQQQFPDYDPGYICQSSGLFRRKEKEWMEELWKEYKQYADSHFLEDFKRQFSQRSWELYFGTTLLNRGFKLNQHKDTGPDFDVRATNNERLTWVEAIAVNKGSGNDKVPDMVYENIQNVPEQEMLLRITNALTEKFKKYQIEIIKGIVKSTEPYVIAINRSGLDHVDTELPLILKSLFGIGHLTLRMRVGDVKRKKPESFWSARNKISKKSGKDVSMLFFEDQAHSGISAIIYCKDNILK